MDRLSILSEKWKSSALSLGEADELIALFVASRDGAIGALDLVVKGQFSNKSDCVCCDGDHRYATFLERDGKNFDYREFVLNSVRVMPHDQQISFYIGSEPPMLSEPSRVRRSMEQAREYLSMTLLHIDENAVGVDHLIHYIRMSEVHMSAALSYVSE